MKRLSNIEYLKEIYPRYSEWEDDLDLMWVNFNDLCNVFENFLLEHVLIDVDFVGEIVKYLNNGYVYHNCDKTDFELRGVIEAYSIAHFLDRFHRFQIIYRILLREGLFPVRKLSSNIIDVGTGPANALIALNFIYRSLMNFGKKNEVLQLKNIEYSVDYVELSDRFRMWLHQYCEYLMSHLNGAWNLPFHHGSFHNLSDVDFQKRKHDLQATLVEETMEELDCSRGFAHWIVDNEVRGWKDSYRYNMVIFSNFLTSIESIEKFEKQIISISRALRNGGIILIVGAPENKDTSYPQIYEKISTLFKKLSFIGLEYSSIDGENKYSSKDRFGKRIDSMYHIFFKRLNELKIDPETYSVFKEKIFPEKEITIDWKFFVYRKYPMKTFNYSR
jgi:hypothetical protein